MLRNMFVHETHAAVHLNIHKRPVENVKNEKGTWEEYS